MKIFISLCLAFLLLVTIGCTSEEAGKGETKDKHPGDDYPHVIVETEFGTIKLELWPDVAPNHVANFLDLVNTGFYNGMIFHRVIEGFVIQSGCPNGDGSGNAGYVIPSEFSSLPHNPGTLSMARGHDYNTASSQFFICLARRPDLDGKYSIFGRTIEGMDVVQKIGNVETDKDDKPLEPIHILRIWEEGKEPPKAASEGDVQA
ncbi:MAG: peptidylprolyl isomerase [Candidatus Zixiibacteriota bacterium]